jgi:hypothetical protein
MDESRKRTAGPDATRTPPPNMPPAGSTTSQSLARRHVGAVCGCLLPPPWPPCPTPPPRPGEPFYSAYLAELRLA